MSDHLVHIGAVIVNGILFDPKNEERLRTMDLANLLKSVPRLFDLLEEREIDYVLVGGIAMLVYVDGRNTQDIELIVSREDLSKLPEIKIENGNRDFTCGWLEDLRIDFLFANNELFEKVRKKHATKKRFANREVMCATVEGLVLLKLFALPALYRQGHFDRVRTYEKDVADLLDRYRPDLQPLLAELAKFMLPNDAEELRKIVIEIKERIAKSHERFTGDQQRRPTCQTKPGFSMDC